MIKHSHSPLKNRLLAALPEAVQQRWLPHLEAVELAQRQVLHECGAAITHVYFPTGAIVSLLYVLEDGASAEVAMVGLEGMVGISVFLGGETSRSSAVVQSTGPGYRLRTDLIKAEFARSTPVMQWMLLYTQALLTQIAQVAVCNRHHSLDQQLCRCLLMCLDRLPNTHLVMTQELISNMLGVRREGVTEAALRLQKAGVIRYTRGHIDVLDRSGLAVRACECYQAINTECRRLLLPGAPDPAAG